MVYIHVKEYEICAYNILALTVKTVEDNPTSSPLDIPWWETTVAATSAQAKGSGGTLPTTPPATGKRRRKRVVKKIAEDNLKVFEDMQVRGYTKFKNI